MRVCNVRIGTVSNKQLYDVEISIACGPLQRSGNKVSTNSVDFRALFKKVSTCCDLRVDGSPMKRSDVLLVPVGRLRLPRFN